ncbi:hypothetical protein KEJ44_04965 [Candidatus Bathyarchaeota archaeon]|nr:hypothetical protein [Candidatus Bathyarchaeota archaeon]
MDIGLVAGLIGLVAAGVSLYIVLYTLGFFQYLGGKKPSPIPPVSKRELEDRLLSLNDPLKPYRIMRGDDTDLVAEWKIADSEWWGIFNKSGLKYAYKASLLLDEGRHSVRCYEQLGYITWTAGLDGIKPHVTYQRSFFGGRILYKKEWAKGYGIKQLKPLEAGKVYDYKFDINEIRGPLIVAVEEGGWEWVPVTAKRHVTR